MRLKTIKLAGFKSFVDPTQVHFPGQLCAIVGPNGCGKSNVIDAVRWVMGESSARNLRGESMADVIFDGSVSRQPVGQASIELVFDNSEGRLGGEYASYAEISTRRLVTREGQSEYFLNGVRCRRRDITDIFLGTGLGPRSYAIIEQGMISRLIESKPEELRVFIEEAAGISRYRERRRETENRMRRTQENLERLTDLRDELERQLQHLQRQAQAAEKYTDYRAEERALKAQLLALQWQALDGQIAAAGRAIAELEVKLESVLAEHRQVETVIERLRVEHSDCHDAFNRSQGRFYALGAEVTRIEQSIQHQQERARQIESDLVQTRRSLEEAEQQLREDRERVAGWQRECASLTPQRAELQAREAASARTLQAAEEAMHDWQRQWDEFNHCAAEPQQQAQVQQSRIVHLEQVLQRLQERSGQLEQERSALTGTADDETATLVRQLAELEQLMAAQEREGDELVAAAAAERDTAGRVSGELNEVRLSIQQMRGRSASLEALQQAAREGAAGDAAGEWLTAQGLAGNSRLLEEIEVEDGWQCAVETVLGDYLQAVCVDALDGLGDGVAALVSGVETTADAAAHGAVALGELTLVEPASGADPGPGDLAAHVHGSPAARSLLAGVRAVASLPEALALRRALGPHESAVTRDGIWVGRNWLRVTRAAVDAGGVIRRQEELETLAAELSVAQEREGRLAGELELSQRQLRDVETRRQATQHLLQESTRRHAELSAGLSAHRARQEQIAMRRERADTELAQAREQYQLEQAAIAEARTALAAAIDAMDVDSRRRDELLAARDATRGALDQARQRARQDKDAAHEVAMRVQALETQLTTMRDGIERTERQLQQLRERDASLARARQDNDDPLAELERELDGQLQQRLQAESDLTEARQGVADVEHRLREAERARADVEQRAAGVRAELEQQRIGHQSLQVQRDALHEQLKADGQDLVSVLETMPEGASEDAWQRALEKVAGRIARLGPINLAAIDEYNLQSERKHYLDAQDADLGSALETLQAAIRKIDRETRNRFRETFERVNSGLADVFPRVFGGGTAYLEMTGDDLLDTGISIMARPPGKKNSTIHLLSGGEKALTAIALVFSIFQLNPAPFCILDEVDAPLDDANTARYARLVREMSEKVQFIYITHNKISMEIADQLLGVTMNEPGVSRLVSVDVEEAAELAAS